MSVLKGISGSSGGGGSGVTSINGIVGAVGLVAGTNISLTPSGNNITIASSGGGGGSPGGNANDVQINNGSGGFSGDDGFSYDGTTVSVPNLSVNGFSILLDGPTGNIQALGIGGIGGGSLALTSSIEGASQTISDLQELDTNVIMCTNTVFLGGISGSNILDDGAGNVVWANLSSFILTDNGGNQITLDDGSGNMFVQNVLEVGGNIAGDADITATGGISAGTGFFTGSNGFTSAGDITASTITLSGEIKAGASTNSAASINMPTGNAPTSPVDGDEWYDNIQKTKTDFIDGIKQARSTTIFTGTGNAALSGTSAGTLFPVGTGTLTLPANFFVVGKKIRITGSGVFTSAASPGNLTLNPKLGSVGLTSSPVVGNLLSSASNKEFNFDYTITCRSTGGLGSFMISGKFEYAAAAATPGYIGLNNGTTNIGINTTISSTLDFQGQFGSTGNTMTTLDLTVEVLN